MMRWGIFLCCLVFSLPGIRAQRVYTPHSVLAAGNWYRVGIKQEGVYKIDAAFLSALGVNTANLNSSSIRLFGNGGAMVNESNAAPRPDDLFENPVEMVDGGDGIFNGPDYFLFYAPGPHRWIKDSASQSFHHQKNLYADTVYYFISVGGSGKRLPVQTASPTATIQVNTYNERYFYETDLVNFLNSGQEWYGEEFNNNLGGTNTRNFPVDWAGLSPSQPLTLVTSLAARSVGAASTFTIKLNGQNAQSLTLPGVSGGLLDDYASAAEQRTQLSPAQGKLDLSISFAPSVNGARGWLNWFELLGRRSLSINAGNMLLFRDWSSVSNGAIAGFTIVNSNTGVAVWEITDPLQPVKMLTVFSNSQTSFANNASRLREYIAFSPASLITPIAMGKVANQDLHGNINADLLIITHTSLLPEAQRLAQFHTQHDGYKVVTATADQIYNEFSGGTPDPGALRDYVKMYYDKAAGNSAGKPKYLLLLGSGSYDYRFRTNANTNLVPVYESPSSLNPLLTYTSDDFFGMLDDGDDINLNNPGQTIDLGIGRIPARNITEAKIMVDKIIRYHDPSGFGAWRNQSVFVADDQDANLHLTDAESVSSAANASDPLINQYKIYLDAYPMVSSSGGARYPAVNDAIVNQVFNGTLILNYTGHGSYQRLAEEAVLTQEELNRFNNPDKLPLFITASCDFAPHDDPAKNSLGAGILSGSINGAIGLLTTTRLVFAYSNRIINENYLRLALTPLPGGQYMTLGESVQQAKNYTSQTTGDILNNRKFTLLGDPAMRIAFPEWRLRLTTINGAPITGTDTLRALQKYEFEGVVTDGNNNPVNNFNGTVHPIVFDKQQAVKTLGNDPASLVTSFNQQAGILYKGNATVANGKFRFSFIVPKDIGFQKGRGRISLYADNGMHDASGANTDFFVGGTGTSVVSDNVGPVIRPYLNDDKFMDGGLTNENPVLIVKLSDSSGISTSGNGIGHDITAVIDGDERNILVLNNFYTAYQDSYQQGEVVFQLPALTEGPHTLRIKAWDVANNSGEAVLHFVVARQEKFVITNVRNYPNPFNVTTTFAFEHNQPSTDIDVTICIYNETGALVTQLKKVVNTSGSRNCQINWAGVSQTGAKLAKGLYIYKIIAVAGSQTAESTRQLIVF